MKENCMVNNKILSNAKWIIGCKIVQSLIQFVVGMLSARYLGPSNYGLINYAAAITAFFLPIMHLGLDSTLVREYGDNPDQQGRILGTALVMNMASAVVCIIGVTSFAAVANRGDQVTILVCALYSTSLFFQAIEMLQYWFQAKLLSKYSSLAMLCSYVVVSAYKIWLLASGKSVYWFALSHAVEYGVTGLLLLLAYRKNGDQKIGFSFRTAKEMYQKSRYYIVAMLMVVLFGKTGSILLTLICNEAENGYFATAVTCTCISLFVFNAIIDTARPVILDNKKESQATYERNVAGTYALTTWLSLAQSIFFTLFADPVVRILYGEAFLPAVPVLRILCWQSAFSYMGYVRNIWILAEEKHQVLWKINLIGVITNVAANAILIPPWGACGAALASVVTQFVTNFVVGFFMKSIRRNNVLLLRGLNPKYILELLPVKKRQDGNTEKEKKQSQSPAACIGKTRFGGPNGQQDDKQQ